MTDARQDADPSEAALVSAADAPEEAKSEESAESEPTSEAAAEPAEAAPEGVEPRTEDAETVVGHAVESARAPLPDAQLVAGVDPRTGHRHGSRRRRIRRLEAQLRLFQAAVGLLGLLLFAAVINQGLLANRHEKSIQSMSYEVDTQRARTAKAIAERDEARAELEDIVKGRIPGIFAITWDEPVSIEQGYVKSALLALNPSLDGKSVVKYSVALDNTSDVVVVPEIDLVIFDRRGFEIGRSLLMLGAEGPSGVGRALRAHGESKIEGRIILDQGTEPGYFATYLDGE